MAKKTVFLCFVLAAFLFGLVAQLVWINQRCSQYPLWGADVFPCRENSYRLIFGGPLGVVGFTILLLILQRIFAAANPRGDAQKIVIGLQSGLMTFALSALIPVIGYRYTNLVLLIFSLFCVVLFYKLFDETKGVGMMLRRWLFPGNELAYRLEMKSKQEIIFQFSGKYSENELAAVYEKLSIDLTLLPASVKSVFVDVRRLAEIRESFDSIYFAIMGFCRCRGIVPEFSVGAQLLKNPEISVRITELSKKESRGRKSSKRNHR